MRVAALRHKYYNYSFIAEKATEHSEHDII